MDLVIATTNKGKLREIKELFEDLPLKITSLADYPNHPEIIENGKTFKENALIKARIISQYTGKLTMGEDSGLEVAALKNKPGIYSARYSGVNATDEKNNQKLLRDLKNIPDNRRQARYRCAAAVVDQNKTIVLVDSRCSGLITKNARGNNGFGYDPYFMIMRYGKTFGELNPSIKAKISHRARAMKRVKEKLIRYL